MASFQIGELVQFKYGDMWEDGIVKSINPLLVTYSVLPHEDGLEYAEDEVRKIERVPLTEIQITTPAVARELTTAKSDRATMKASIMKATETVEQSSVFDQESAGENARGKGSWMQAVEATQKVLEDRLEVAVAKVRKQGTKAPHQTAKATTVCEVKAVAKKKALTIKRSANKTTVADDMSSEETDAVQMAVKAADVEKQAKQKNRKRKASSPRDEDAFEAEVLDWLYVVGKYRVTNEDGVPVNAGKERSSPNVGHLKAGSIVEVVEFAEGVVEGRIRARIVRPAGWISTRNTKVSYDFAVRMVDEISDRHQREDLAPLQDAKTKRRSNKRVKAKEKQPKDVEVESETRLQNADEDPREDGLARERSSSPSDSDSDDSEGLELRAGDRVVAIQDMMTDNETAVKLRKDTVGEVKRIDDDGDAMIYFRGIGEGQWIFQEHLQLLSKAFEYQLEKKITAARARARRSMRSADDTDSDAIDTVLDTEGFPVAVEDEAVSIANVMFKPGKIGITAQPGSGVVETVKQLGQAHLAGVNVAWTIVAVDDRKCETFDGHVFQQAKNGNKDYQVTFQKADSSHLGSCDSREGNKRRKELALVPADTPNPGNELALVMARRHSDPVMERFKYSTREEVAQQFGLSVDEVAPWSPGAKLEARVLKYDRIDKSTFRRWLPNTISCERKLCFALQKDAGYHAMLLHAFETKEQKEKAQT